MEAAVEGELVKVKKETEDGAQIIGIETPCVLTFTKPSFDPRYPTIKRKMTANKANIPVLAFADLTDIDPNKIGLKNSPTRVKKTFVPQKKTGGIKIQEETAEESTKKLFGMLSDAPVL